MTTRQSTSRLLRNISPRTGPAKRLVIFPHAGGSAAYYRPLGNLLSETLDVWVAQYPGRQDRLREPGIESIPELAKAACAEIMELSEFPLVLFGHSLGALVAYEACRTLQALNRPVQVLLIVSGRRSPALDGDEQVDPHNDASILAEVARLGSGLSGICPDDVAEIFLPSLRADYRAVLNYTHDIGDPLNLPVRVFYGNADPLVSREGAHQWQQCTTGDVSFRVFEGDHFYFGQDAGPLSTAIALEAATWRANVAQCS